MAEEENTDNTNVKIAGKKVPLWTIFILGILAGNYDKIIEFVVPDLKKIFVTHEDIISIKEDIKEIKAQLQNISENKS